jgi:hypothetical protein
VQLPRLVLVLARGGLERRRGVHRVIVERQRLFIHTSEMSLPYLSSTPFTVGSDRLQNGH